MVPNYAILRRHLFDLNFMINIAPLVTDQLGTGVRDEPLDLLCCCHCLPSTLEAFVLFLFLFICCFVLLDAPLVRALATRMHELLGSRVTQRLQLPKSR